MKPSSLVSSRRLTIGLVVVTALVVGGILFHTNSFAQDAGPSAQPTPSNVSPGDAANAATAGQGAAPEQEDKGIQLFDLVLGQSQLTLSQGQFFVVSGFHLSNACVLFVRHLPAQRP